jgi:hypothetical protein
MVVRSPVIRSVRSIPAWLSVSSSPMLRTARTPAALARRSASSGVVGSGRCRRCAWESIRLLVLQIRITLTFHRPISAECRCRFCARSVTHRLKRSYGTPRATRVGRRPGMRSLTCSSSPRPRPSGSRTASGTLISEHYCSVLSIRGKSGPFNVVCVRGCRRPHSRAVAQGAFRSALTWAAIFAPVSGMKGETR